MKEQAKEHPRARVVRLAGVELKAFMGDLVQRHRLSYPEQCAICSGYLIGERDALVERTRPGSGRKREAA